MRLKDLVDKETIVERSNSYGNNFPFLVQIWKNFLKQRYGFEVPLTPGDVAFMFALHKISRLVNNPGDQDTLKDLINYAWLGTSYDEYVQLLNQRNNSIVQNLVNEIKNMDDEEEKYCFWYKKNCIYSKDSDKDWGQVKKIKKCPMGYPDYQDCDFNCPIEIN